MIYRYHLAANQVAPHPLFSLLASFPIVCFSLTLLSDLAYWQTANLLWQHFSEWLLLAGLVFALLAVIAGAIDLVFRLGINAAVPAWPYLLGAVLALVLAFINSLVHSGDGWTAVVPNGLILSLATVLVMIFTGWFGPMAVSRHSEGEIIQ